MLTFHVHSEDDNLDLKQYLRRRAAVSLTAWRKLKRAGSITVNGEPATARTILHTGDRLHLVWQEENHLTPTAMPLRILYEDEFLLVIDKPAGMLVHPTVSEDGTSVGNLVTHYYQQKGLSIAFHPIHRLDRGTSGILAIAKVAHIQQILSTQNHRQMMRTYLALVHGTLPPRGSITAPIARKEGSIIERTVSTDGQDAHTDYETLLSRDGLSLVRLTLHTGRTHQIRVHMASIGHPLIGDDLYGSPYQDFPRQALHSAQLSFVHPITRQEIRIRSSLPNDMTHLLMCYTN
ncbi:MAG: RluA family pseudouridine synthase [Selenomonadales bacterium]|nr:RluA family pseudouridine synthase [Selenomonadales bacterium]